MDEQHGRSRKLPTRATNAATPRDAPTPPGTEVVQEELLPTSMRQYEIPQRSSMELGDCTEGTLSNFK